MLDSHATHVPLLCVHVCIQLGLNLLILQYVIIFY